MKNYYLLINHKMPIYSWLFVNHRFAKRTRVLTDYLPLLLYGLVIAAAADWLIGRTFSRTVIFMPKPPLVSTMYQLFAWVGQLAAVLTGLLALGWLGWIAWYEWLTRRAAWLPLVLLAQAGLSLVFLFVVPVGWWLVVFHGLSLAAMGLILVRFRSGQTGQVGEVADLQLPINNHDGREVGNNKYRATTQALALLLPALALLFGKLYQTLPALYAAGQWPGPPPLTGNFFNLGELCVVFSPVGLWYVYGCGTSWRTWLVALGPALAFSGMYLVNPAMTGILAMWSIGLSLYLPWPLYAISLWLASVTVIVSLRRKHLAGGVIFLLVAGGYAAQLSSQTFLGLVALWLLRHLHIR